MKKTNKGFTIVELVVVIAVVAVLAAVLIPTFTSIIKKANDSAYLQERQNQRIEDLAEKIDNAEWLSWEDVEKAIATAIAESEKTSADQLKSDIKTAVETALAGQTGGTGLKEEQVKQIVEKALEGQLTREQVDAIVVSALKNVSMPSGVTVAQVQQLVNQALASQPATGLTLSQVQSAISTALSGQESSVTTAINNALAKYASENPTLTEDQITEIVEKVLAGQTPADPYLAKLAEIENDPEATGKNYAILDADGVTYAYDIPQAQVGTNGTIILISNVTLDWFAGFSNTNITVDLNGHNLTVSGDGVGAVTNVTMTFKDSKGTGTAQISEVTVLGASSLVFESGTYSISLFTKDVMGVGSYPTIKGGTFNFDPTSKGAISGSTITNNGNGTWTVSAN